MTNLNLFLSNQFFAWIHFILESSSGKTFYGLLFIHLSLMKKNSWHALQRKVWVHLLEKQVVQNRTFSCPSAPRNTSSNSEDRRNTFWGWIPLLWCRSVKIGIITFKYWEDLQILFPSSYWNECSIFQMT